MVSERHRGHGVDRELLARFVAGQRALLCTHRDSDARRPYEATGWRGLTAVQVAAKPLVCYGFDCAA